MCTELLGIRSCFVYLTIQVPYILFLTCLNDQKSVQTYVVTSSECEDLSVDCQITRVTDVLQTVQIKFLLYIVL